MRITISGLPGSGTTSLTYHLAELFGLEVISAGEVFRQMAKEKGMSVAEFGAFCEQDPSVDKLIDERQREIALSKENIIIEGRLSGWMIPEADLRIWLKAGSECRVRRILNRDAYEDISTAISETEAREASEALRYQQYYSINIRSLDPYHLVLDTELWTVDQLAGILTAALTALRS